MAQRRVVSSLVVCVYPRIMGWFAHLVCWFIVLLVIRYADTAEFWIINGLMVEKSSLDG